MKNTRAMLWPAYTRKMEEIDSPISPAKIQKQSWAAPRLILFIRADRTNTITSGAKITTHLNGLV